MCREEQPEVRWPLMPALWGSLTRTRVSEPPPFPEPQVAAILLSSNGPVAYLGPGMGRLGRWPGAGGGGGEVLALPSVNFQREQLWCLPDLPGGSLAGHLTRKWE